MTTYIGSVYFGLQFEGGVYPYGERRDDRQGRIGAGPGDQQASLHL